MSLATSFDIINILEKIIIKLDVIPIIMSYIYPNASEYYKKDIEIYTDWKIGYILAKKNTYILKHTEKLETKQSQYICITRNGDIVYDIKIILYFETTENLDKFLKLNIDSLNFILNRNIIDKCYKKIYKSKNKIELWSQISNIAYPLILAQLHEWRFLFSCNNIKLISHSELSCYYIIIVNLELRRRLARERCFIINVLDSFDKICIYRGYFMKENDNYINQEDRNNAYICDNGIIDYLRS